MPLRATHIALVVTAILCAAGLGPLEPPSGPITPSGKSITELQPRTPINAANTPAGTNSLYRITTPGSYYLTGNLQGASGKHGIEIVCSGVTLDLNGFELFGGSGSLDGISLTATNQSNIAITNGSIRGWGGSGIDMLASLVVNGRVSEVRAANNGASGIAVGTDCVLTHCQASNNLGNGFNTGAAATITECSSYGNGINGFNVNNAASVTRCSAYFNVASGINALTGCTIENNNCRINSGDGVKASASCVIRANTCTSNGFSTAIAAGIHVTGTDNLIEANACSAADTGIDVDAGGNVIVKNHCTGNTANWAIASGNAIGPIVTAGTTTSAVNGNGTAASTLGTTDPFANFNY
ncbi:MAG: hypothetical protein QM783_10245 [Phycisphaerales bacterium]